MREYKKYRGLVAFVAIAFGMLGYSRFVAKRRLLRVLTIKRQNHS